MPAIRVSKRDRIEMGVDTSEASPKCDYCGQNLQGWGWEHEGNLVCRGCYSEIAVCQIDGCELDGDPLEAPLTTVDRHGNFQDKTAVIRLCYRHMDLH